MISPVFFFYFSRKDSTDYDVFVMKWNKNYLRKFDHFDSKTSRQWFQKLDCLLSVHILYIYIYYRILIYSIVYSIIYSHYYYWLQDNFYTKLTRKICYFLRNNLSHFSFAFYFSKHKSTIVVFFLKNISRQIYPNLSFVLSILTSSIDSPSRKESY